jgi:hypothetical protein
MAARRELDGKVGHRPTWIPAFAETTMSEPPLILQAHAVRVIARIVRPDALAVGDVHPAVAQRKCALLVEGIRERRTRA